MVGNSKKKPVALYYSAMCYQEDSLERLSHNFDLITLPNPDHDTIEILRGVEVLFAPLGYKTNRSKIDNCSRLRVIASNTTGYPHIDVEYASNNSIKVITLKEETEFLNSITPTAELAWGLIIALTRNLLPAIEAVRGGHWNRWNYGGTKMLSRMKLGIVGMGRLGRKVASYGKAAGMSVAYYDPFVASEEQATRCPNLTQLVAGCDVITIHVPHNKQTEKMFNKEVIASFSVGSFLVNTSRGELIDQEALVDALVERRIAGAALDVFEGEFEPDFDIRHYELWKYSLSNSNLLITPHIGGSTIDAWSMTEGHTITKILEFLR